MDTISEERKAEILQQIQERREEAIRRRQRVEAAGEPALKRLVRIAQGDTGQSRRVRAFLLGLYNGYAFPLDLTELRALDMEIADDVLAVLAMDMDGPRCEVQERIDGGWQIWREWAEDAQAARAARADD